MPHVNFAVLSNMAEYLSKLLAGFALIKIRVISLFEYLVYSGDG